jgi:hypothetical protein
MLLVVDLLVSDLILSQFVHPSPSPLQVIGTPLLLPSSTISPNLSHIALSPGLMFLVRQWTVRFLIPVLRIRETRTKVDGWVGSIRILHEIGRGILSRSLRRILRRRSGVERRAAPMPECVLWVSLVLRKRGWAYENGLGHPQLRSLYISNVHNIDWRYDVHPSNILLDNLGGL